MRKRERDDIKIHEACRETHSLLDEVMDDNGIRWSEQRLQALWNLCELHTRHFKDLQTHSHDRLITV